MTNVGEYSSSLAGEGAADVLRWELANEAEQTALEYGTVNVDGDDGGEDEDEESALPVISVLDEGHDVGEDEEDNDQGKADQQSGLSPGLIKTRLWCCQAVDL